MPATKERGGSLRAATRRGRLADPAFRWIATIAGASVLLILGLMLVSTTGRAWPVFRHAGLSFFTSTRWSPGVSRTGVTGTYGALSFIYGTLVTSLLAILIAVPLAVAVALFLTEVAPGRLRRPLTYTVEM